eukprot:3749555-Pleurochrysis_carterae.AAC.1
MRARGHGQGRGTFKLVQTQGSGRASMPSKSARATLFYAGAEHAACGIAKLEYGSPIGLLFIVTHI